VPPRVPFVDLARQHGPLRAELDAAFDRVVGSSGFILGEEVERFEAEFADYCGAGHCAGVASGTAALTLAALALGIGDGDEVIVPAHTYIASALGLLHAGARPVFCDVHDDTGLLDADAAAALVGPRTAAILPVHLYGQCCDMDAVGALASRHGLAGIEDAAQAHGATWNGRRAGSFGAAAAFSFYPSKNLGALGDGGAVCAADAAVAERVRELRNIGQRGKGEHVVAGWNERLDGLQAALLRVKLRRLDSWNEARRRHAAVYREAFGDAVRMVAERPESPCVFHLLPVRVSERARVAAALSAAGVATGVHYSPALPDQPPFADAAGGEFPAARAWAAEELSLPMFPEMTPDEVEHAASACLEAVGG
jgi:dTDP-4-amino-4,6-dideoxygalactose transaminase